jgi:RNA polymerase subunit RPABC4/transcription elongation factor Spt4
MSVSIIACPSCKSLVLPDTAQCPNCNFVFDEKRALVEPPTIGHVEPTEEEIPCPGCNELVKKGLVRCWNCGTFMQSHIAETYKRMQISPPKVIYSEPSEDRPDAARFSGTMTDSGRLVDDAPPPDAPAGEADEDFEFTGQMGDDPDEGDFDLGTAEPPATPNEIVQSAPVFALRKEEEEEPKESAKSKKGGKAAAAPETAEAAAPEAAEEVVAEPAESVESAGADAEAADGTEATAEEPAAE